MNYTNQLAVIRNLVITFILLCVVTQCSVMHQQKRMDFKNNKPVKLSCQSCDYVVPMGVRVINSKGLGIKPGDIICLNADFKYNLITFEKVEGTAEKPVIVTNCNGTATINAPDKPFVIRFNQSKHFRFTGGNTDGTYGIKLTGSKSNGLVLGHLTTNYEVDHIESYDVGFAGIMAKTDPTCDDETIRGNFVMRDVSFHHNYIHDTHGEGFYIGHSSYGGKETPCGTRLPHVIENIKVYKNIVRNSGWDGIQVSSAPKGAMIYDNIIENYATQNKRAQSSGICIGGGTGGYCYNNLIKKGSGPGITVFGLANNTIHNNMIIDAGGPGIFCDERTKPGDGFRFINNTIINPNEQGIVIYAEKVPTNLVWNNLIINPGKFDAKGDKVYIAKLGKHVNIDDESNLFIENIDQVKFHDPASLDFRLTKGSPVIDKGKDVSAFKFTEDFYNNPRLKGKSYDIGATEF